MTDAYGDAITQGYWDAARRKELVVQRCASCGAHQAYPRPYCITCMSSDVSFVPASGAGTIYSMTTVHMPVSGLLEPPYVVAVVELDEGVRVTANILGEACAIGDRVRVVWFDRENAPPLPMFERS